jgi:hypothetical protein
MKHEKIDVIKLYDGRGKIYVVSVYAMKVHRASGCIAAPFLILALHVGEWLTSRPAPVPIAHEAEWAPKARKGFWRREKSLPNSRIRNPDCPPRSLVSILP